MPSELSDFLGLPTEIPEILAEVIRVRALTIYDPEIAQISVLTYALKSCERQFHLRLNASSLWQYLRARRSSLKCNC